MGFSVYTSFMFQRLNTLQGSFHKSWELFFLAKSAAMQEMEYICLKACACTYNCYHQMGIFIVV
jgi:hypothetical protein